MEAFTHSTVLEIEEMIGFAGQRRAEVDHYISTDGWFDPGPLFREHVWVSLPMKPLCRVECLGICPECGTNLNQEPCECREEHVDPRMAALAKLLE